MSRRVHRGVGVPIDEGKLLADSARVRRERDGLAGAASADAPSGASEGDADAGAVGGADVAGVPGGREVEALAAKCGRGEDGSRIVGGADEERGKPWDRRSRWWGWVGGAARAAGTNLPQSNVLLASIPASPRAALGLYF